jgi:hypothetical protein
MTFVLVGLAVALLSLILGLVLRANADFARNYVHDELAEQQITFKTSDKLQSAADFRAGVVTAFGGDQQKADQLIADYNLAAEAETPCLVTYAGQVVDSGDKARCYAENIRRNLRGRIGIYASKYSAVPDRQVPQMYTYATMGPVVTELRDLVTAAKENNDPKLAEYEAAYQNAYDIRVDSLSRGELERGALLTSYGFSQFGERANMAATVCWIIAGVLLLAAVAGLLHFFKTQKEEPVGYHGETNPAEETKREPQLVG